MLRIISSFLNRPIVSLQTGSQVAVTTDVIIDPDKLQIVAFRVTSPKDTGSVLLYDDIREINKAGLLIDHFDKLVHPEDLVRLEPILRINFQLIGKSVRTESKQRLGKVNDYIVDDQTFYIARLYTKQSLLKNLTGAGLTIDRSQIIEVNDSAIIVRDNEGTVKSGLPATVSGA